MRFAEAAPWATVGAEPALRIESSRASGKCSSLTLSLRMTPQISVPAGTRIAADRRFAQRLQHQERRDRACRRIVSLTQAST